jgi:hypothetical protein
MTPIRADKKYGQRKHIREYSRYPRFQKILQIDNSAAQKESNSFQVVQRIFQASSDS